MADEPLAPLDVEFDAALGEITPEEPAQSAEPEPERPSLVELNKAARASAIYRKRLELMEKIKKLQDELAELGGPV